MHDLQIKCIAKVLQDRSLRFKDTATPQVKANLHLNFNYAQLSITLSGAILRSRKAAERNAAVINRLIAMLQYCR